MARIEMLVLHTIKKAANEADRSDTGAQLVKETLNGSIPWLMSLGGMAIRHHEHSSHHGDQGYFNFGDGDGLSLADDLTIAGWIYAASKPVKRWRDKQAFHAGPMPQRAEALLRSHAKIPKSEGIIAVWNSAPLGVRYNLSFDSEVVALTNRGVRYRAERYPQPTGQHGGGPYIGERTSKSGLVPYRDIAEQGIRIRNLSAERDLGFDVTPGRWLIARMDQAIDGAAKLVGAQQTARTLYLPTGEGGPLNLPEEGQPLNYDHHLLFRALGHLPGVLQQAGSWEGVI
jgi:hypothetical protein